MARAKSYLDIDVLTAARQRLRHVYEIFDSVVVMFSGGKDSMSCVHLAKEVHDEFDLGPVEVIFRDEEIINPSVLDFVDYYRNLDWINLRWYCLPSLNHRFILGKKLRYVEWGPDREWMRPMPEWAITAEDLGISASQVLTEHNMDDYLAQPYPGKVAFITGVRAAESLVRFRSVTQKLNENYIGSIEGNPKSRVKLCKPIYDWSQDDVLRYLLVDKAEPICLAGETEFITRDGPRTLADACGEVVEVITSKTRSAQNPRGGYWSKAEIQSFGIQQLWRISLTRDQRRREVLATAGHRWLVANPDRKMYQVCTTESLRPGARLAWSQLASRHKLIADMILSPVGIMMGFVFGDGHVDRQSGGSRVCLWGEKDANLLPFFANCRQWNGISESGIPFTTVGSLPAFFKSAPPLDESIPFLYGWLAGYFAADGDVNKQGSAHLTSFQRENLQLVKRICTSLGIGTLQICEHERKIKGRSVTAFTLTFDGQDLTPGFFLIPEHRARYTSKSGVRSRRGWKVEKVEATDRLEEVYCAIVPDGERFLLADDILTMNCPIYDAQELAGVGLRVSTPLHTVAAKKFDKVRAVEPEFYEQIIRIFPEMAVQERYWHEFDSKAMLDAYVDEDPGSYAGVFRYIDEHFSGGERARSLERVELWRGRRERDPDNYPIRLLLQEIALGSSKRRLAGVYTQSKGEIAKRARKAKES